MNAGRMGKTTEKELKAEKMEQTTDEEDEQEEEMKAEKTEKTSEEAEEEEEEVKAEKTEKTTDGEEEEEKAKKTEKTTDEEEEEDLNSANSEKTTKEEEKEKEKEEEEEEEEEVNSAKCDITQTTTMSQIPKQRQQYSKQSSACRRIRLYSAWMHFHLAVGQFGYFILAQAVCRFTTAWQPRS